jgi:hypothetical protein
LWIAGYSSSIRLLERWWGLLKGRRGSVVGWWGVRLLDWRRGEFPLGCLSCEVYVEPEAEVRASKIEYWEKSFRGRLREQGLPSVVLAAPVSSPSRWNNRWSYSRWKRRRWCCHLLTKAGLISVLNVPS